MLVLPISLYPLPTTEMIEMRCACSNIGCFYDVCIVSQISSPPLSHSLLILIQFANLLMMKNHKDSASGGRAHMNSLER